MIYVSKFKDTKSNSVYIIYLVLSLSQCSRLSLQNNDFYSFPVDPSNITFFLLITILFNFLVPWYLEKSNVIVLRLIKKILTMLDQFLSVKFNHSVMSDSLWSHGLQHTRPPCPSPTSRAYSNSRSLSQWCHPTICRPLLLPPSIFPSIGVFSNESVLHIMWPKYWSFSFNISPSNEYWGLISFRMDWCDLLVVQGTLKHLLQHHSSKASVLQHSASFIVQLSHPYSFYIALSVYWLRHAAL